MYTGYYVTESFAIKFANTHLYWINRAQTNFRSSCGDFS